MNKQIEEMAKAVCVNCMDEVCASGRCAFQCDCPLSMETIKKLYNAGYRKQSEGEWIVTDADSGSFGEYEPFIEFKCSNCQSCFGIESGQYDWQYGEPIPWVACPLCGEKMKGGEKE
jgi:hypothetical protein